MDKFTIIADFNKSLSLTDRIKQWQDWEHLNKKDHLITSGDGNNLITCPLLHIPTW